MPGACTANCGRRTSCCVTFPRPSRHLASERQFLGDPQCRRARLFLQIEQYGPAPYRMAAAILGGLLIVGISYLLLDGNSSRYGPAGIAGCGAAGSIVDAGGRCRSQRLAPARRREAEARTRRRRRRCPARSSPGSTLRRRPLSAAPMTQQLTAASDQVTVQLATGSEVFVLEFSGAAPIQLQLRSGGRLLARRQAVGQRPLVAPLNA